MYIYIRKTEKQKQGNTDRDYKQSKQKESVV